MVRTFPLATTVQQENMEEGRVKRQSWTHAGVVRQVPTTTRRGKLLATPAAPAEDTAIPHALVRCQKAARLCALWESMAISKAKPKKKTRAQIPVKQGNLALVRGRPPTASAERAQTDFIVGPV